MTSSKSRKRRALFAAVFGLMNSAQQMRADSFQGLRRPTPVAQSNGATATVADSGVLTILTGVNGQYLITHNEWVALAGSGATGTFQASVGCTNSGGAGSISSGTVNLSSAAGTIAQGAWPITCVSGNLTYHVILNAPTGSATVGYEWAVYRLQ